MIWILGLGLVVRLLVINQSLWLDEAIGAIIAKSFSFSDIIFKFPLTDNHPPLYYLILKAWTTFFGYSEISLRIPSVIFGVAAIYLVFKIVKEFTKINPLVPALLLATSPLHIYYSQEARMYSLACFLATGAVYYFLRILKESGRLFDWAVFSIFYTALAFSDYVPVFLYPVFVIYALVKQLDRNWWGKFVLANTPLAVLGTFWIPILRVQSEKGRWLLSTLPAWGEIAGGATVKHLQALFSKFILGRVSFFDKNIYLILVLIAAVPFVIALLRAIKSGKAGGIFWLWLIVPSALGFAASFWFPVFIYFRYVFILPAFYILLSLGLSGHFKFRKILIGGILAVNMLGLSIYIFDKNQQREDWRGAVQFTEGNLKKDEAVIFDYPEPFAPYQWYTEGALVIGAANSISVDPALTEKKVSDSVKNLKGLYYFNYLENLTDPDGVVPAAILKEGFVEAGETVFRGVGSVFNYIKK